MSTPAHGLWTAVGREHERVTPLELFFDLVFVLALTQCTAPMAREPTWEGRAKGPLVLGVLGGGRGSGYAWLTSVIDPEDHGRSVIIALVAERRLADATPGGEQNEVAVLLAVLIAVETAHFAELRERLRPGLEQH